MHPALPYRVVVIGSSTAAGAGADPVDSSWVNLYRAALQTLNPANEVVNLAQGGYQTWHLMPSGHVPPPARPAPDRLRNISKALSLYPDAIIVNLPSNDAAAGYSAEEQMANFDTIAATAREAGVPVWICTAQPRNFDPEQIRIQFAVRDAILARYGEQALNFWDGLALPDGSMDTRCNSGDGIHLNNEGHRLLFERVRDKNILAGIVPREDRGGFLQALTQWTKRQRDRFILLMRQLNGR